MTPEAANYLDKARADLDDARKIAGIGLAKAAARCAYYAAFHAAEAFIVERTGKVAKTHAGVRSEFARLAKHEPRIDKSLSTILAKGYQFKEICDYGVGSEAAVRMVEAEETISNAGLFLDKIATLLDQHS